MSGEYKVSVAVGVTPVPGSPFRVPCQHPRPSEVATTVELGNGHGFMGETFVAIVNVKDQLGQM